ncbi:MAG: PQQ-dependent sugar dehydrogenase [Fimbriimonas sp.]
MTKQLLLTSSAILAGISCIASTKVVPKPDTLPQQRQQVSVTQFYEDTCAKCHGRAGEGGGGGTKSLIDEDKFEQKHDRPFFDAIKNGVPDAGMEAYGATMSDQQIWAQVVHIRELQAKGLRAKNGSPKAVNGVYPGKRHNYRIETVSEDDMKTPWAIDWLPEGKMLVTNLPGTINVLSNGELIAEVEGLPASRQQGQGGLMDVAVHPSNGWVYLAFSDPGKERGAMTKVVRGKVKLSGDSATWTDQQTILEFPQEFYSGAGIHFGSRIAFDKSDHVFIAIGERGTNMRSQEFTNPFGKIFRLNTDGTIPTDNPTFAEGAIKGIWSTGHRNQQGLAFDLDGNLWTTEHGPRGGDEVNKVDKGANYGWPIVLFGINYNDTPFSTPWPKPEEKITLPAFRWLPSIGASGLDVATGKAFPQWKGDLLAGGLSGANLDRLRMKDGQLVEREELIHGMGRIREVAVGPDGYVYVAINQPDKIIRLMPAP